MSTPLPTLMQVERMATAIAMTLRASDSPRDLLDMACELEAEARRQVAEARARVFVERERREKSLADLRDDMAGGVVA